MPIDPATFLILRQAVRLISGVTDSTGWTAFLTRLQERAGQRAADLVVDLASARPKRNSQQQVAVLNSDPQLAAELPETVSAELGQLLRIQAQLPADARRVLAYGAVLWQLAALAYGEKRPIAVAGALQGCNWVTVCDPTPPMTQFAGWPTSPPSFQRLWHGRGTQLQRCDMTADFYVKPVPSDSAPAEACADLNHLFKVDRDNQRAALRDAKTWHRIETINGAWVQLDPNRTTYMTYPPQCRSLIDLPNDMSGLACLDAGIDAFLDDNKAHQAQLLRIMGRRL